MYIFKKNAMKNKPAITMDILIEELINDYSFSIRYLMEKGIRCIRCGEPIWGTLEEAAKEKNFDDAAIQSFIQEMNDIANMGKAGVKNDEKVYVQKMD